MNELIENAGFRPRASGRDRASIQRVDLEPVLLHTVEKLRTMHFGDLRGGEFRRVECTTPPLPATFELSGERSHTWLPDHPVRLRGHTGDAVYISIAIRAKPSPGY